MSAPMGIDRLINTRYPVNDSQVWYVRTATGNDNNDGLTPATAFATLDRGFQAWQAFSYYRQQILDVTDCAFAANEILNLPQPVAGVSFDLDAGASGPNNYVYRSLAQLRAAPTLVQSLTVTNVAADAVTGMVTLTVSEALVPSAHIGQFVIGSGLLEYGTIAANDASTITVASTNVTWTAQVGIYEPSCSFTFGDSGNFFNQAVYLRPLCEWFLSGIDFRSTGSSKVAALSIFPGAPVNMQLCKFEGLEIGAGAGAVQMDACDIHSKNYGQVGGPVTLRSSVLRDLDFNIHGDAGSGINEFFALWIENCQPFGQGNFESRFSFQLEASEIVGSSGVGILHSSGAPSRAIDCRVRNSASHGALCRFNSFLRLENVQGTGNGGVGCKVESGSQVQATAGTGVTGAGGDVQVGANGAIGWGSLPDTDLAALASQICRAFN